MKHTSAELTQWQALPLPIKIRMTEQRIRDWVHEYGEEGCYVSFSGGKDSTVLLDIVRNRMGYTNVPAVFVDTGLEYPEIREFVKTFDNVDWLKPKMNFRQVIEKYGYPFPSKEVAHKMADLNSARKHGHDSYVEKQMKGEYVSKNGKTNMVSIKRWAFLLDSPYLFSHECCNVMKKEPVHRYSRETGRYPISAQMASESMLRRNAWLMHGCNMYSIKHPISNPMAFWTEQDVLQYIKMFNIPICSVYGEIVPDEEFDGQTSFIEEGQRYKTTGCDRTGCMFCGFGCHLNNDERFVRMKETHPNQYEYIMRPKSEGGLNYKEVIDWLNTNGDLNIRY